MVEVPGTVEHPSVESASVKTFGLAFTDSPGLHMIAGYGSAFITQIPADEEDALVTVRSSDEGYPLIEQGPVLPAKASGEAEPPANPEEVQ